jgi:hypothetical protein
MFSCVSSGSEVKLLDISSVSAKEPSHSRKQTHQKLVAPLPFTSPFATRAPVALTRL